MQERFSKTFQSLQATSPAVTSRPCFQERVKAPFIIIKIFPIQEQHPPGRRGSAV